MLYDKRTFPNFLRAMLDHRDGIHAAYNNITNIDPKKATWGERCRYEKAIAKRDVLNKEIKATLIAMGVNKQMAARLAARFLWNGYNADAMAMEAVLDRRSRCKCRLAK